MVGRRHAVIVIVMCVCSQLYVFYLSSFPNVVVYEIITVLSLVSHVSFHEDVDPVSPLFSLRLNIVSVQGSISLLFSSISRRRVKPLLELASTVAFAAFLLNLRFCTICSMSFMFKIYEVNLVFFIILVDVL